MNYHSWRAAFAISSSPLVGAHRGASKQAPENTLATFDLAIRQGAHFLELDVRLTKDAIPIVIHDATLKRTTNYQGQIKDLTAVEIKKSEISRNLPRCWRSVKIPSCLMSN